MKCFVYCEWIDDHRLRQSMPEVRLLDRVVLPDHRLAFTSFVEDADATIRPGGCNLVYAQGNSVPGLLYELDAVQERVAETLSRVAEGRYTPRSYEVVDRAGITHQAVAYVLKHPLDASPAPDDYRLHMLAGARRHEFPEDYIRAIEAL
ncbi:MAG: gamma-glutamylcyclotransferase [Chloroflexi bacterium]|nr:gamma-glutamylcyclotransferase [Chloroflexota bacterium]